jgi:dihydroxyacetone kinase
VDSQGLIQAEHNRSPDNAGPTVLAGALACAAALEAQERQLTELDSAAGDGDLGISMARGAAAVRTLAPNEATDAASTLTRIAGTLRRAIGGSSGPFYAVGLLRAAQHLASCQTVDGAAWAVAFKQAVDAISELGGARPGDCTMLDALYPAAAALQAALRQGATVATAWADCVAAAEAGTVSTAQMRPRLGRSSYLGNRALGLQDPGAVAVTVWLRALTAIVR